MGRKKATRNSFPFLLLTAVLTTVSCSGPARPAGREPKPKLFDIRLAVLASPRNLIPDQANILIEGQLTDMIYNNLVRANYSGALAPELAEKWEISPDGKEYTFHLRRNALFHNGKPLTADDVIFTLKRLILDAHSRHDAIRVISGSDDLLNGRTAEVAGLKKINPHTLKIKLEKNFKYFLELLAGEYAAILPENFAGKSIADFNENPIGTGPFRLGQRTEKVVKNTKFSVFRFLKNRSYYDQTGNVEHVDFYFSGSEISTEAKFYFDIIFISPRDNQAISASPEYKIINTSYNSLFFIILNPNENAALGQRKIRQRIQYGIDREKLVSTIFNRQAIPAHSMIPYGLLGQNPGYRLDRQKWDRLPFEADSAPVSFTLMAANRLQNDQVLAFLQNDMKRLDVRLTIQTVNDPDQFFTHTIYHSKNSILVGGIPDYPATYDFLSGLTKTGGFYNLFQVPFPESAAAVRELPFHNIIQETRAMERINLQLEEEAVYIPLYYYSDLIAVNTFVKKIDFKFGQIIDFSRMEVIDE